MTRERRCYVCDHPKCLPRKRVFLLPGEPAEPTPRCPDHGPLRLERNKTYNDPRK